MECPPYHRYAVLMAGESCSISHSLLNGPKRHKDRDSVLALRKLPPDLVSDGRMEEVSRKLGRSKEVLHSNTIVG